MLPVAAALALLNDSCFSDPGINLGIADSFSTILEEVDLSDILLHIFLNYII